MPHFETHQTLRTITLEEHFATPAFLDGPGQQVKNLAQAANTHPEVTARFSRLIETLCDLDERRIAEMDRAGIDMQVLSLTSPGTEQLDGPEAIKLARETNDLLAEAVHRHPDRFAGLATLPTAAPEAAAAELERVVSGYGFKGAVINGHCQGRYLDDPFFWPLLEQAEALRVPIYLHPTQPPQPVVKASYTGNFAPGITDLLIGAAWGWHIETAIHMIRLILSGAFDRYPGLQFVVGHLGEGLPFMLNRLDSTLPPQATRLQRPVGAYLRENLHYTFSGFNYLPTFLDLWLQVGVGRIMFSADYPYASMEQARAFLEQIPVTPTDRERIAHGNAEALFHL